MSSPSRAAHRSPTVALLVGLVLSLTVVVAYTWSITGQISGLRRLQTDLTDRNRRESLQLLARAVGRLPADFRSAFLLRVEEGLSFRQVGEVLGITEETARWRVFKARQKLLSVMAPELGPEKQETERKPE